MLLLSFYQPDGSTDLGGMWRSVRKWDAGIQRGPVERGHRALRKGE